MGPVTNGYKLTPGVWKYNDEIKVNGGTVWATMDTRPQQGLRGQRHERPCSGARGATRSIQSGWGWQYSGTSMMQMWGDSGMCQEWDSRPVRPLHVQHLSPQQQRRSAARRRGRLSPDRVVRQGRPLSRQLRERAPADEHARQRVGEVHGRRPGAVQLVDDAPPDPHGTRTTCSRTAQLTGTGLAPTGWSQWNDGSHDPCTAAVCRHVGQLVAVLVGRRDLPGRDDGLRRGRHDQVRRLPLHARQRPPAQRHQVRLDPGGVLQRRDADLDRDGPVEHRVGHDERRVDPRVFRNDGAGGREPDPLHHPLQRLRQRRRQVHGRRCLPEERLARRAARSTSTTCRRTPRWS